MKYNDCDLVYKDNIILCIKQHSKKEIITMLSGLLKKSKIVTDSKKFMDAVYDREIRGSTYCGDYLALPHGSSDCVTKPSVAIAKMKYAVPWDENGNLVKLVIMLVIPKATKMEEESEVLKMVASSLGDRKFVKQLLNSNTKESLIELINNCLNDSMRSQK